MAKKKRVIILLVLLVVVLAAGIGGFFAMESYTATAKFCGTTCHIMDKPYKSWQRDKKHSEEDVSCIKCHYAPGEKGTLHARFGAFVHLFRYLYDPEATKASRRAEVKNASCEVDKCHPPSKYQDKNIRFVNLSPESKFVKGFDKTREYSDLKAIMEDKGMPFLHKTHMDPEKLVEGQKMHCNTCHQHVSAAKHFEVPKEACFLCHFKNSKYNKDRAKCSLCHAVPTKSLRKEKGPKSEDPEKKKEPITHQSMEKNKVPCQGCHYVIQGGGEIKKEACYSCHDVEENLQFAKSGKITKEDKKKMHEEHIADQNANCFHCHGPMKHEAVKDFNTAIVSDCKLCHEETHTYQRMLLAGDVLKGEAAVPGLMKPVNTNCMGCHYKFQHDKVKGRTVAKGTHEGCVGCHTKRHKDMLKEWKDKVTDELKSAVEVEQEAVAALKKAKGKVPKKTFAKAEALYNEGQKYLNIVRHGNGVHNKKYSIILIDAALGKYEDMIDYLSEGS
jgi:hypothetical protein